jgi:uncharacterized C2H2 Zn-finger protein
MIDSKLLKSLGELTREKHALGQKAERLAQTERRLIGALGRSLSTIGYGVVPLDRDRRRAARPAVKRVSTAPKRLRCPRCDRRFSHPLPMARHVAAAHSGRSARKKASSKATRASA